MREEYSKWNSSVSKSCSRRGPEARGTFVSEAAKVKSARTSCKRVSKIRGSESISGTYLFLPLGKVPKHDHTV